MSASRFEKMLWPRWLPETARMPLIAQVTGAVALTALIMGPWWSRVPSPSTSSPAPLPASAPAAEVGAEPLKPVVTPVVPVAQPATRPAHLNLDVRHSFSSADLSVTVDGKRVLDSTLEGSGKKFRMFGKREQRSFTRSLDLPPGVRVVNVRLKSPQDKFDQTRTERFELGAASVASMRITAERNALDVIAQHPPIEPAPVAVPAATTAAPAAAPVTATAVPIPAPAPLPAAQRADAVAELVQSVRSMLIAIAGFIASAATGFVVQEFMRSKKSVMFSQRGGRRRRGEGDEEAVEAP
jgi:hypothetical protein